LRVSAVSVEIWHDARMVALHPRLDRAGDVSTDPNHMPPHHLARRASAEEDLQIWARLQSDAVQTVAKAEVERPLHGAARSASIVHFATYMPAWGLTVWKRPVPAPYASAVLA
jgi:hypothetical protein